MSDLISRKAVERAIKKFNKKRVDKIPRGLSFEENNKKLNTISEENDEMLRIIKDIPIACNVEKVAERLEKELELADEEKRRCAKENPLQFDSAKGYATGIGYALENVRNDGKTDKNNGWIPVEKRLPKDSLNSVIGWDDYRKRCCFAQYYGGRWRLPNSDIESVKITAWQPLPDKYVLSGKE